ncbi:MAG TPA: rod shape-determining protein MreC [Bryobacteraceae bacterium]|nr:rod shape-determining protein MreC [Bryobacteraceae bacterium]
MEFLLTRFRNLTVLLVVVLAQLLLLAYQVKGNQDVRLIRVWSVTAVTPVAKVLEVVRRNTIGVVEDYFVLVNIREENRRLTEDLGKLKMENHFLRSELQTAERAQALGAFQARTPSRTIPARIIGTGTGANSRVVYVDQGTAKGIMRGMAVVTPEGIVGKVLNSYPTASQVLLITDPSFAAGVISQKNRVHGTIKGQGQSKCTVEYVQNEEKVEVGEMFYTSGDDRIFPKGMPVGRANVVRIGKTFKEIFVVPTGFQNGLEEVLIVIQGEHQPIPEQQEATVSSNVYLMKAPQAGVATNKLPDVLVTDADKLREQYKSVGDAQGHQFGEGGPGAKPPNFNLRIEVPKAAPPAPPAAAGTIGETNPPSAVVKPKPAATPQLGPDGQPIVPRPKVIIPPTVPPGNETNPAPAVTKPKTTPAPQIGPDGQPIVPRPKVIIPPTVPPRNETNPAPAVTKPKTPAPQIGPDGQPIVTRPKTSAPSISPPVNETNPAAPAAKPKPTGSPEATKPRLAPSKRVSGDGSTINIVTPAPKAKPAKPEGSSPPPTQ